MLRSWCGRHRQHLPDWEELDEYEDAERERLETNAGGDHAGTGNAEQVREEIAELLELAEEAKVVEGLGQRGETWQQLRKDIMQDEGFLRPSRPATADLSQSSRTPSTT